MQTLDMKLKDFACALINNTLEITSFESECFKEKTKKNKQTPKLKITTFLKTSPVSAVVWVGAATEQGVSKSKINSF